jgi:multiple sugar transport system substrate-binding protein
MASLSNRKVSRRQCLTYATLAVAGVSLAACGQAASSVAVTSAPAAAGATASLTATSTAVSAGSTTSAPTSALAASGSTASIVGSSTASVTASALSANAPASTAVSAPTATATLAPTGQAATGAPVPVTWAINFVSGPRRDYVIKALAQFQQDSPAIKVTYMPVDPADFYNKMTALVASGSPPDIMHGSGANFLDFAIKGALGQIDSYLKADKVNIDGYYKQADIFSWQGKQYGMPFMENVTIFVYNKTLFASASVAPPTEQWTWDDMLQAAQKLTKPGQFGLRVGDGFEFNWLTFIWSNGGEYLSQDLKKTMLSMPETVAAFQWLVDLKTKYNVSPHEGDTSLGSGDPFMTGKVAMMPQGTGSMGNWVTGIKEFDWDLFPVPLNPRTGKRVVSSNGNPELLSKQSKHPDQAWQLLKFIAGPYSQGLIGDMKVAVPTRIATATDPNGYLKAPPVSMRLTDADIKVSRDLQFCPNWLDWYNEISKDMLPAFKGTMSVADAARQADQVGDSILQKP